VYGGRGNTANEGVAKLPFGACRSRLCNEASSLLVGCSDHLKLARHRKRGCETLDICRALNIFTSNIQCHRPLRLYGSQKNAPDPNLNQYRTVQLLTCARFTESHVRQEIHPHSSIWSLRGTRTPGPEVDAERKFKSGESSGVHPRLAIDGSTDDGTTDTGATSNLSNPMFVGDDSQLDSEQTSDFGHRVGTLAFGPVVTEMPGCWPDGTRHSRSIGVSAPPVLHSMNKSVTVSSCADLSKEQSD